MGSVAVVEKLGEEIRKRLSDARISSDAPDFPDGPWWIDVTRAGRVASIEWRPAQGFGISAPNGGYGEGPDWIANDVNAAAEKVVQLLSQIPSNPEDEELEAMSVDESRKRRN